MKFIPLDDFVFLIYKKEKSDKKGIILSDISPTQKHTATVEAVGPQVQKIKKGDTVAFDPFAPRVITWEGQDYLIIREKYIYGKIQ